MGMSGKEFAALRGVDPSRVSQWKKQGRLVLDADGKINAEASNAKLNQSLNPAKGGHRNGHVAPPASQPGAVAAGAPAAVEAPAPEQPPAQDPGGGDRGKVPSWSDSKARREKYDADLAELKALQAAGALTSVAGVRKEAAETARALRNAVLAVPDRLAQVLDPRDPARAHKLLTDELQKVLREFGAELEQRAAAAAGTDQRELALQ